MSGKDAARWNPETEGRLALLLRSLASAQEGEREKVIAAIAELCGPDAGKTPERILSWYLQTHLGFARPFETLRGEQANSSLSETLKNDFLKPEYDWCASEKAASGEDLEKLKAVHSDLESALDVDGEGPLGFTRLSGAPEVARAFFRGKSLSEAVFSPDITVESLRVLKDYGKLLMLSVMPTATQRTGAIVYAAAISQALVAFDATITSLSKPDLAASIRSIISRPYIVESYQRLFSAALAKCEA